MALVHCRYGCDHLDAPDLGDGWLWLCLDVIGAEDAPGDRLEPYHNALPLCRCSCGYDPRPREPKPKPKPDGYWHPGHP